MNKMLDKSEHQNLWVGTTSDTPENCPAYTDFMFYGDDDGPRDITPEMVANLSDPKYLAEKYSRFTFDD